MNRINNGIIEATMPIRPQQVSLRTKVQTIGLVLAALLIVGLYIGVPLAEVVRTVFRPLVQDVVVAAAIIIEVVLLMIAIIRKTDGKR